MHPHTHKIYRESANLVSLIADRLSDAFRHDSAVVSVKIRWEGQLPKERTGKNAQRPGVRVTISYGGTDEIVIPFAKTHSHRGVGSPGGAFQLAARIFDTLRKESFTPPSEVLRALADQLETEGAAGD